MSSFRSGAPGEVEIINQSQTSMNEKKLTFAERVEFIRAAAEDLRQITAVVAAEFAAMAGAAERFAGQNQRRSIKS